MIAVAKIFERRARRRAVDGRGRCLLRRPIVLPQDGPEPGGGTASVLGASDLRGGRDDAGGGPADRTGRWRITTRPYALLSLRPGLLLRRHLCHDGGGDGSGVEEAGSNGGERRELGPFLASPRSPSSRGCVSPSPWRAKPRRSRSRRWSGWRPSDVRGSTAWPTLSPLRPV